MMFASHCVLFTTILRIKKSFWWFAATYTSCSLCAQTIGLLIGFLVQYNSKAG